MGWNDYPADSVTVPAGAVGEAPRVFIGQGDPLLEQLSQQAGIVFYFSDGRAFVLSVQRDTPDGTPPYGELNLYVTDGTTPGLHQLAGWTMDAATGHAFAGFGDAGGKFRDTSTGIVGTSVQVESLNGDITLKPNADDIVIDGGSLPRALVADVTGAANPAGPNVTSAAEVEIGRLSDGEFVTMQAARRYKAEFHGRLFSTVAGDRIGLRIYQGSVGGTLLYDLGQVTVAAASISEPFVAACDLAGAAGDVILAARRVTGTGTCSVAVRYAELYDRRA